MESIIETHPFGYFIPQKADKLILGSFPCFNGRDYGEWFYSGSGKSEFWRLMADVFSMPANNKSQKMQLCEANNIAITDIAYRIERKHRNCLDANLKIHEINKSGVDKCLAAGVKAIYFTSKLVSRHFYKHYQGNTIPSHFLPSPSPAANIYIAGLEEYRNLIAEKKIKNAYEYRLLKYKALLKDKI